LLGGVVAVSNRPKSRSAITNMLRVRRGQSAPDASILVAFTGFLFADYFANLKFLLMLSCLSSLPKSNQNTPANDRHAGTRVRQSKSCGRNALRALPDPIGSERHALDVSVDFEPNPLYLNTKHEASAAT
jgi:hypothetical protein